MCGINGFLDTTGAVRGDQLRAIAAAMANAQRHRGPDDAGTWVDNESGLAFGHRRLSIIDLSPDGHQPMTSADGRYVITFNGELYNFVGLRETLEGLGHRFRSRSDTEVMLTAFSAWGIEAAIPRFNGMFAFAVWDRQTRRLFLARDRLGEKPLYYGWMGGSFLFASEIHALRAHPHFRPELNRSALALFLRFGYVPAPDSIYRGVFKLPAGTFLSVTARDAGGTTGPTPYWSAREAVERGVANPFEGTPEEALDHLDGLLRDTLRMQMLSDVPLGAFLSGGIDSSTVVSLMQAESSRPVRTFSIGFHEAGFNEAPHAKAVAAHLGTDHTELYATPADALELIPRLPACFSEPFADPSQLPTWLLCRLARGHVTVALSGDGGDELFTGYDRYFHAPRLWERISRVPSRLRRLTALAAHWMPPEMLSSALTPLEPLLPESLRHRDLSDTLLKVAEVAPARSPEELYFLFNSHWRRPEALLPATPEPVTSLTDRHRWARVPDFTRWMMYQDLVTYLPDDILVKVDRAAMNVALETRVPLLDHRVVEFAWRLPLEWKVRDGQGKWLLRQLLYRYVPKSLIERPKMGFGVPIADWLRGPLREWAESLLAEQRLRQDGIFSPGPIRERWQKHLSGSRSWHYSLWNVLMFQAWKDEYLR